MPNPRTPDRPRKPAIGPCKGVYDLCPFEICKCRKAKGPGRPREYAQRMPRVTVRLDAETVELARWLGDGNLSRGLRIAVRVAEQAGKVNPSPAADDAP